MENRQIDYTDPDGVSVKIVIPENLLVEIRRVVQEELERYLNPYKGYEKAYVLPGEQAEEKISKEDEHTLIINVLKGLSIDVARPDALLVNWTSDVWERGTDSNPGDIQRDANVKLQRRDSPASFGNNTAWNPGNDGYGIYLDNNWLGGRKVWYIGRNRKETIIRFLDPIPNGNNYGWTYRMTFKMHAGVNATNLGEVAYFSTHDTFRASDNALAGSYQDVSILLTAYDVRASTYKLKLRNFGSSDLNSEVVIRDEEYVTVVVGRYKNMIYLSVNGITIKAYDCTRINELRHIGLNRKWDGLANMTISELMVWNAYVDEYAANSQFYWDAAYREYAEQNGESTWDIMP